VYFDGIRFTLCRRVVTLPAELFVDPQYVRFGRVVEGPEVCGAVETAWQHGAGGEPVWAVQIEPDGWSLTNMMYGKDGRIYLCVRGRVYSAPGRVRRP
jgi:hypothetical protein